MSCTNGLDLGAGALPTTSRNSYAVLALVCITISAFWTHVVDWRYVQVAPKSVLWSRLAQVCIGVFEVLGSSKVSLVHIQRQLVLIDRVRRVTPFDHSFSNPSFLAWTSCNLFNIPIPLVPYNPILIHNVPNAHSQQRSLFQSRLTELLPIQISPFRVPSIFQKVSFIFANNSALSSSST